MPTVLGVSHAPTAAMPTVFGGQPRTQAAMPTVLVERVKRSDLSERSENCRRRRPCLARRRSGESGAGTVGVVGRASLGGARERAERELSASSAVRRYAAEGSDVRRTQE